MNQETEKPSASDYDGLVKFVSWTPFIAGAVFLALVAAYIFAFYQNKWTKTPDGWGQFGDYIGGLLNPLVAGFALVALVVSIRIQKTELTETRQAMQEQTRIAEQQRSEQRFFDILKIYNTFLDQIKYSSTVAMGTESAVLNYTGKEALSKILLEKLDERTKFGCINYISVYGISGAINYLAGDKDFNKNFQSYCNTVFSLLNYCFQNKIESSYISLFSSQLTRDELVVISIYSIINKNYCKEILIDLDKEINLFSNMNGAPFLKVIQTYLSSDTSLHDEN